MFHFVISVSGIFVNRFLKNFLRGVFQSRFSKQSFENLAFPSTFESVNKSWKMAVHPCISYRLLFQEPVKNITKKAGVKMIFQGIPGAAYLGRAVPDVRISHPAVKFMIKKIPFGNEFSENSSKPLTKNADFFFM
jgi:hypothetical protein